MCFFETYQSPRLTGPERGKDGGLAFEARRAPDRRRIGVGGEGFFNTAKGIAMPPHTRRIGHVFQDTRLLPHMSLAQNLSYGARLGRSPRAGRNGGLIVDLLGMGALPQRQPRTLPRLTRRSAIALHLAPGKRLYAVLTAVCVVRDSIGHSVPPETPMGAKGTNTPGFPP